MVRPSGTRGTGSTRVRAGRPLYHGPRARAVIWPPLRLARMRRERGSVVAVLPARSRDHDGRRRQIDEGGGPRHPPRVRRSGDAEPRRGHAAWPGRHDPRSSGGVRAEADARRPRGDRGDRERDGGRGSHRTACRPGRDREPAPGAADRRGPDQDRRGRRHGAGPALRQRLLARGLGACRTSARSPGAGR